MLILQLRSWGSFKNLKTPTPGLNRTPDLPSMIRPAKASALNPAKTTLWMAPILAQANIAVTAVGDFGM